MIQETCVEIGELEARWTSLREARNARRQKIRYIDELIDAFEKLNLADEVEVPYDDRLLGVRDWSGDHIGATRPFA